MNAFLGAPAYNTVDYFAVLFLVSLLCAPLSCLSRRRLYQNILHIVLGSVCLFTVAPRLLVFYAGFWVLVYVFTVLARWEPRGLFAYVKVLVPIAVVLVPMVYWKLDQVAFERFLNINVYEFLWRYFRPLGEIDSGYAIVAPLGLSFSTFRAVDLLAEVNLGVVERPTLLSTLAYGFFAPIQIVGPISQYKELDRGVGDREKRVELARWGALQILIGVTKAFVISWPLAWSAQIATLFASQPTSVIWLCVAIYPIYLFLNFSGFSDVSIGFAAIYGYKLEPNFDRPLVRTSLQSVWSHWHMTLTRFAQRTIFVPLGGYRKKTQYIAVFFTMMVIALWHGLTLPFFVYGALHGIGLILGRVFPLSRIIPGGPKPGEPKQPKADSMRTWVINGLGWAGAYSFFAITLPLALLETDRVIPFYAAMIGVRL